METTFDSAHASVSSAIACANSLLGNESVVYGLCRPPGHHASQGMGGGYCFFNNVVNCNGITFLIKIRILNIIT